MVTGIILWIKNFILNPERVLISLSKRKELVINLSKSHNCLLAELESERSEDTFTIRMKLDC